MITSISICLVAFVVLALMLRWGATQSSLGLPLAYLFGLLLIHVPGAIAHALPTSVLPYPEWTAQGIGFTAIGSVAFVMGVGLSRVRGGSVPVGYAAPGRRFWVFCLVAGWLVTYGLTPLTKIPTVGAAIGNGAAIWMLGVMLGLREGSRQAFFWAVAMMVFPVLMLLLGGFLSYGSTAIMICLGPLAVSTRSHWRVALGIVVVAVGSFHVFLSYFQNREDIRDAVWYGAAMENRISQTTKIFTDLKWFDPNDGAQQSALDQRLNQNFFVGLAAERLADKEVDYLNGRSLWEGFLSLVPRILWPDKPVYGGSPKIVSEMTGLELAEGTSFGVGQVMEFHVNFGVPGIVIGFLILGWVLGILDRMAAVAERAGNISRLFKCFLPAVALIQPNGAMVELFGCSAAAWVAAVAWSRAWSGWSRRGQFSRSGDRVDEMAHRVARQRPKATASR